MIKKLLLLIIVCSSFLYSQINVFGFDYNANEDFIDDHYFGALQNDFLRKSNDGKYGYYFDEKSESVILKVSYEQGLSVLEVPEKIDGYPVKEFNNVYTASKAITKIVMGKNIEVLTMGLSPIEQNGEPCTAIPLCNIKINDGAKYIYYDNLISSERPLGYDPVTHIKNSVKLLIIPESVEEINCLYSYNYENIILESDVIMKSGTIVRDDHGEMFKDVAVQTTPCNIYYATSSLNTDPEAFSYEISWEPVDDLGLEVHTSLLHNDMIKLFKKQEYRKENELEKEYPSSVYTNEWWKDIKEIDSVTLSGAGLNENKTVTQKLSDSELKWMDKEYSLQMTSGEKVKLNSTFAPADAFDDRMFFVSLNEDVVKVDVDSGEVTALKKGAATVRCVAASGVFSDVVVYVDGATAADLPDNSAPAATAANTGKTADTTKSAPNTTKTSEPAKGSKVNPVYIAVPAAAVVAAALAAAVVIKKRRH